MSASKNENSLSEDNKPEADTPVEKNLTIVYLAFAQPAILELIIRYVILNENGDHSVDNIRSLRLVQKPWISAVSKVLNKYGKPLYTLSLNKFNSLNHADEVKAKGKILDRFVNFYSSGQHTTENAPKFWLDIDEHFFRLENYKSFNCFLRQCGHGLQNLKMKIPKFCGSLPGVFSNMEFSVLERITVTFTGCLSYDGADQVDFAHDANVILFLQCLLSKAESLKSLLLTSKLQDRIDCTPYGIQFIGMPKSLKSFGLECDMENNELEMLCANALPNLSTLTLIAENLIPGEDVTNVLNNIQKTVQTLAFFAQNYCAPRQPNLVNLPVMEQLEILVMQNAHLELEDGSFLLSVRLPKLKTLLLCFQTPSMIEKWISNGPLPSVTNLTIQLLSEHLTEADVMEMVPIKLDLMHTIHQTFHNVRELCLFTCGKDIDGLRYIFKEMRQLTKLSFSFNAADNSVVNSDHWDALLIGVPEEFIACLRKFPSMWNKLDISDKDEEIPSIRLLSELKHLELHSNGINDDDSDSSEEDDPLVTLISDLSFIFALLKMPKLTELELGGKFTISDSMLERWTEKGGRV